MPCSGVHLDSARMCPSKANFGYPFESDQHYEQHREAFNQSYGGARPALASDELSRHPSSRARWYHRGWRTPLPRRKSTNPLANSCGREATLRTSNRSRTRAGPAEYPPRALVNRPTLIAAVMAVLPSRLGRAACPSEIAVIEPPI